ncbi:hypothetical protein ACI48D_12135 [Massilia sp. LXY-6]
MRPAQQGRQAEGSCAGRVTDEEKDALLDAPARVRANLQAMPD